MIRKPIALALLLAPALFAANNPWYQTDFPPEEFRARWNKLFDKMGNQAIGVLQGAPLTKKRPKTKMASRSWSVKQSKEKVFSA